MEEKRVKMKATISKKNKYWISKHRYYELAHFCRQYDEWKKNYAKLQGDFSYSHGVTVNTCEGKAIIKPVEKCAERMMYFTERMRIVEQSAIKASPELAKYIIRGATKGLSYDKMKATDNIPCCREVYYEYYRRFFWHLSQIRE